MITHIASEDFKAGDLIIGGAIWPSGTFGMNRTRFYYKWHEGTGKPPRYKCLSDIPHRCTLNLKNTVFVGQFFTFNYDIEG